MKHNSAPSCYLSRRTFVGGCVTLPLLQFGLSSCSEGESTDGWIFDPHNPVLGGQLGVCFDPFVLKDGATYRMWFSWRSEHSIAYTESTNSYEWSGPKIVLSPDPAVAAQIEVNRPSVLIRDNVHHMWYTGQSADASEIYHATSFDGLKWVRTSSAPVLDPSLSWEKLAVMAPDVLWLEDKASFRMYYSAAEQYEPDCIALATSPDAITWTRRDRPILTAESGLQWERAKVTGADVHRLKDWYYMFYVGFADVHHANMCLARSRDGMGNWERHPANPILRAPGMWNFFAWDRDAVYKPSAVMTESGWAIFFNARRRNIEQIGVAFHPGHDLGFPR